MAVIINDFEIMVEPPGQQQGVQAASAAPARPPETMPKPVALQPQDIERIVRHFEERRLRLAAD
jgi:DNA topoisomerase VI subunit B